MRVLKLLGSMFEAVCQTLGLAAARKGKAAPSDIAAMATSGPASSVPASRVPAVAGFVWRLPVDRFFLARRLTSIAKLNTPLGRKPHGSVKRSAGLPPIPASRIGAKKTRLNSNEGRRVVKQQPVTTQRGATVIPFPGGRTTLPVAEAA